MNWINIHTDTLRDVAYIGADPVERGTWLSLLGWCCAQENGGVIEGCKNWKSRKWQQLCGVTKEEAETISELYGFDGDNLMVNFYPIEQEAALEAKREAGAKGGRPRKHKDKKPYGYANENHMGNHERNVKKSKVKKGKERESSARAHESSQTPNSFADEKQWINSLKPEWKLPARWSYVEEHALMSAAGQIAELSETEKQLISQYMKANLQKGAGFWQPNSRKQFVESFADVCGHAQRWARKTGRTITEKPANGHDLF